MGTLGARWVNARRRAIAVAGHSSTKGDTPGFTPMAWTRLHAGGSSRRGASVLQGRADPTTETGQGRLARRCVRQPASQCQARNSS